MLGALRRCPAPSRLRLLSSTCSSPTSFHPLAINASNRAVSRTTLLPQTFKATRNFHISHSRWNNADQAAIEAQIEQDVSAPQPPEGENLDDAIAQGPVVRFRDLADKGLAHQSLIRAISDMKIDTMTQVQSLTINEALTGKDVVAQARTGTGKTLAFLLPIVQRILQQDPSLAQGSGRRTDGADIRGIIISPTRELAEQIAVEAERLCRGTSVRVQRAVGGTARNEHLRKIRFQGCHLLVGTPGRLKDLLSDPSSGVQAPMLDALVLDEADRLMDQGFWPDIQEIQDMLPRIQEHDRQTLLFSATMPKEVVRLARSVMKNDLHFVQTVQEDEVPTHERVPQKLVAVPGLENFMPALVELIRRETSARSSPDAKPFKAIVYFASTAEVSLATSILLNVFRKFRAGPRDNNPTMYGIHSRLTQSGRTRAADSFRRDRSAVLLSTDVTARGLDFPGVTHVVQIGLPRDRETYVHRIGRTGRAGAEGEGWLILPFYALNEGRKLLHTMPMTRDDSLQSPKAAWTMSEDGGVSAPEMSEEVKEIFDTVRQAAAGSRLEEEQNAAYAGAMGSKNNWNKGKLVEHLNRWAAVEWDRVEPPSLTERTAKAMGLTHIPGINIQQPSDRRSSGAGRGFGRRNDDYGRGAGAFGSRQDAFGDDAFGRSGSDFAGRGRSGGYDRRSHGGDRDRRSRGFREFGNRR